MMIQRIFAGVLASLLFAVGSAEAVLIGPELLSTYDAATDGAVNQVLTVYSAFPFPATGVVSYLESNVQDSSNANGGFIALQLRPDGGSNYTVVASQSFSVPTGANPDFHYSLTTPWNVQAGDLYADFGQGVPYNNLPKLTDPNPASPLYYPSTHTPATGDTITLGGAQFPLFSATAREYGLAASFVPEPASCVLFGVGAVGLLIVARRRRKA